MKRTALYFALLLVLLHQDFWFWDDSTLLPGFLPVGLAYQAIYCLATSLPCYLLVTYAWPDEAEAFAEGGSGGEAVSPGRRVTPGAAAAGKNAPQVLPAGGQDRTLRRRSRCPGRLAGFP
jgi:hypothetical protein